LGAPGFFRSEPIVVTPLIVDRNTEDTIENFRRRKYKEKKIQGEEQILPYIFLVVASLSIPGFLITDTKYCRLITCLLLR
jgi:hypothetical protein